MRTREHLITRRRGAGGEGRSIVTRKRGVGGAERSLLLTALAISACARGAETPVVAAADQDWTRGAVCYEIFVRSFADSDGNGIGDFNGLTSKLDYINDANPDTRTDLGASCLWLMPVAQSPSYHGYDVADYYTIESDYGTNDDFKRFMVEAHRRGIRVLVDMVLNHASSEHPSFQAAVRDTASPYRGWYRFSPTALGKGPWGADAWHKSPASNEYYYGVFWSGMPDLNYGSEAVREEAKKIATFWLRDMDVDGFRLDAIPYLTEDGECLSGCPATFAYLREYAAHLKSVKPNAYTVGEAWGPIDMVMPYYPDQLTSYFGFELSDSLLAAVNRGTLGGMLSGYLRLQDTLPAHRWSPFLTNHDGTRAMTRVGGDLNKARLAATLLLTLPGLPFVYYGEEIGMIGDKPDERLRTPMQWSPKAGLGFTTGKPWENAQPDSFTTTVDAQNADTSSLLNLYRRLIHLRRTNDALAAGRLVPLTANNPGIAAYLRRDGVHTVLIVANLSAASVTGVTITSTANALPAGRYTVRNLMGGADGAELEVAADGLLANYQPVSGALSRGQMFIFDLISR
jgi:alpha-amylase